MADANLQSEKFRKTFSEFREKKIALYGIGRYTVTLLPNIQDYKIIGLLDRDTENIGRVIAGVKVIRLEEACEKADCIIINTTAVYWKTIYERIKNIDLPVYCLDGTLASELFTEKEEKDNPYFKQSREQLEQLIYEHDVISFDLFDTLVTRKAMNPKDSLRLLDKSVAKFWRAESNFLQLRDRAAAEAEEKAPTIDDIYRKLQQIAELSDEETNKIKQLELEIEKKMLIPRKNMVDICNQAVEKGKMVYIISDMYLPLDFFEECFKEWGICVPANRVWISCEKKLSKASGKIWSLLREEVGSNTSVLHIGDNENTDIKIDKKYVIDTYYVASPTDMMMMTDMAECVADVSDLGSSLLLGTIVSKLFNDPFVLCSTKGKIQIADAWTMGYAVMGIVIVVFLLWLYSTSKEEKINRLWFLARDGYFLKEDYDILCDLLNVKDVPCEYVAASRHLMLNIMAGKKKTLEEIVEYTYSGKPENYLKLRFGIDEKLDDFDFGADDWKQKLVSENYEQIMEHMCRTAENYERYIVEKYSPNEKLGVVDLVAKGTMQHFLQRYLEMDMAGFYMVVCKQSCNSYFESQCMQGCYEESNENFVGGVSRYGLMLESFLTAPYGMIREIDEHGEYICGEKEMNQIFFWQKEIINQGIIAFMKDLLVLSEDMVDVFSKKNVRRFVDNYFYRIFEGGAELLEEATKSFYYDNALIHEGSKKMFE